MPRVLSLLPKLPVYHLVRCAARCRSSLAVGLAMAAAVACSDFEPCELNADGQPFSLLPAAATPASGPPDAVGGRWAASGNDALARGQEANALVPLVCEEHLLEVPGLPAGAAAFNPGMARWAGRDVAAFRVELRNADAGQQENLIAMGRLDPNRQVDGPVILLDLPHAPGRLSTTEDPRLVVHRGRLYLVYNAADTVRLMGPRTLHLARIGVDTRGPSWSFRVENSKTLFYPGPDGRLPRVSKNWSPFVADGQLHFIFSSSPLQVLRVDNADLDDDQPMLWCEAVAADTQPVPWRYGPPRGGTQAIYEPLLRRFVTFFHSRRRCRSRTQEVTQQYLTGAYTFTPEAPFTVDQVLPHPLLTPTSLADIEGSGSSITFVSGLVVEDDALQVIFGHNDDSSGLMTLDKWRLYSQLVPVAGLR